MDKMDFLWGWYGSRYSRNSSNGITSKGISKQSKKQKNKNKQKVKIKDFRGAS